MQLAEQVSEDLCFQKSAFRDMKGLAFSPYISQHVCNLCGLHTPDFVLKGDFINHCTIASNN